MVLIYIVGVGFLERQRTPRLHVIDQLSVESVADVWFGHFQCFGWIVSHILIAYM